MSKKNVLRKILLEQLIFEHPQTKIIATIKIRLIKIFWGVFEITSLFFFSAGRGVSLICLNYRSKAPQIFNRSLKRKKTQQTIIYVYAIRSELMWYDNTVRSYTLVKNLFEIAYIHVLDAACYIVFEICHIFYSFCCIGFTSKQEIQHMKFAGLPYSCCVMKRGARASNEIKKKYAHTYTHNMQSTEHTQGNKHL